MKDILRLLSDSFKSNGLTSSSTPVPNLEAYEKQKPILYTWLKTTCHKSGKQIWYVTFW